MGGPPSVGDHPRSRGVYNWGTLAINKYGGSSPLARGLPRRDVHHLDDSGIIPARAGFTQQHILWSLL